MEVDYKSGIKPYCGDRKLEIVEGKDFSANQSYITKRSGSPDLRPSVRPQSVSKVKNSSSMKSWSFKDPETKRRKRIAKYKIYGVEGRVKASVKKGFRWIKNKCSEIVHSF